MQVVASPVAYHHSLFSGLNYWLIRLSKAERESERGRRGLKSRTEEHTRQKKKKKKYFARVSREEAAGFLGMYTQVHVNTVMGQVRMCVCV